MRKQSKSILSMILSAAMVLTLGAGAAVAPDKAVSAEDGKAISKSFTATLKQNSSKIFNWVDEERTEAGEEATGVVATSDVISTTGEYTIGAVAGDDVDDLTTECTALWVSTDLGTLPTDFTVKGKSLTITHEDGTADTYDWNATLFHEGLKDTAEVRLGVTNSYVPTRKVDEYALSNPFQSNVNGTWAPNEPIPVVAGDKVELTFAVTDETPVYPGSSPAPATQAPSASKSYNAYLHFQTDNYTFRDVWDNDTYGSKSKDISYNSEVGYWDGDKLAKKAVTIKNATISQNSAEYTVSISGLNLQTLKGNQSDSTVSKKFLMLGVSTNIPVSMKGVKATATVKIDGKACKTNVSAPNNKEADYYDFMISNTYSDTQETADCAYPKGKELSVLPTDSIEVTFKVTGVDFDLKNIGYAKGKTFTSGNFKYKVTKAATQSGTKKTNGNVTLVGLSAKGKKASSLKVATTVSATVNKVKATYNITALGSKAMKGAKAKTVSLSSKIKKIPSGTFNNCTKLATLKLSAKLSSVSKNAFKGCKKTIKVSGTSKKDNVKKITKSGYKKVK